MRSQVGSEIAIMCMKLASMFVHALRVAHKCLKFDSITQRHWSKTVSISKRPVRLDILGYLSSPALTVEDILREYASLPPGCVNKACEHELSWYFKLVEDRITRYELDCAILHLEQEACNICMLQHNLERAVAIGAHFLSTGLSIGASNILAQYQPWTPLGSARTILRLCSSFEVECDLWVVFEVTSIVLDAIRRTPSLGPLRSKFVCATYCKTQSDFTTMSRSDFSASLLNSVVNCGSKAGYAWIIQAESLEQIVSYYLGAVSSCSSRAMEILEQEFRMKIEKVAHIATVSAMFNQFCLGFQQPLQTSCRNLTDRLPRVRM